MLPYWPSIVTYVATVYACVEVYNHTRVVTWNSKKLAIFCQVHELCTSSRMYIYVGIYHTPRVLKHRHICTVLVHMISTNSHVNMSFPVVS